MVFEMQPMGRETKILLGLLGSLCGVLVISLIGKLTIVRPPDGAGVDVLPPEPSAVGHITVDPPDYRRDGEIRAIGQDDQRIASLHSKTFPEGIRLTGAEQPTETVVEPSGDESPGSSRLVDDMTSTAEAPVSVMERQTTSVDSVLPLAEPTDDGGESLTTVDPPVERVDPIRSRPSIRVGSAVVVADGDTWWNIAERAYGDGRWYRPLYAWNKKLDPRLALKSGTRIVVPTVNELEAAWSPIIPRETDGGLPGSASGVRRPPPVGEVVVREGDTLLSLAREHLGASARWRDLYAWNRDRLPPTPGPLAAGTFLRLEPRR